MQRPGYFLLLLAALEGAAGVALAAAAAHLAAGATLDVASRFLMIHAAAGLALSALLARTEAPLGRWLAGAGFALLLGVALFAGDLTARAYGGERLFPYAAPIGGSLTIASWIALAAWALAALRAK